MLRATDHDDRPEGPTVTLDKLDKLDKQDKPPLRDDEAPQTVPVAAVQSEGMAASSAPRPRAQPGSQSGQARPPSSPPPGPNRRFARFRRRQRPIIRVLQVLALAVLVFIGLVGYSLGGYLTRAGNDSVAQRVAEWARDHHLDPIVTWAEKVQYDQNKPKTGGTATIPTVPTEQPTAPAKPKVAHSALPEAPKLLAGQGLPNEGKWTTVVTSKGYPAVQLTYVRPDNVHTSYYAALMWMDPKLLSGRLHEGIASGDPGGTWPTPPQITPELAKTVATAFPGGFRTDQSSSVSSRGGYYDDGREAVPLRVGAASLVIFKDGTATVGAWGRDIKPSPKVKSVRQNLDLLIDGGAVNPTCSSDSSPNWGYTVGNDKYVPRTALGIRQDGSLIFVNSPAVSVCSLGTLLQSAGVVRGMELDINYDWSIGYYFTHQNGQVQSHVSRDTQSKSADHYFSPQSRDFVAFYLRP